MGLKLFGREIIFFRSIPTYVITSRYLNVTDRQTDGQMDRDDMQSHNRTMGSIAR